MGQSSVAPLLFLVCISACASSKTSTPTTTESVMISGVAGSNSQGAGSTAAMTLTSSTAAHMRTFAVPLDRIWTILPAVYDSLGVAVALVDARDHTMGNANLMVRRRLGKAPLGRYLDCGSTQGANSVDTYDISLYVVTKVVPETATSATVATTVEARGKPVFVSSEWSKCTSTGKLESAILNGIAERLK